MTGSSTSSSTTTITRFDANAASFCTPSSPQIWVLPCASARWACTMVTSGLSAGTVARRSPVYGHSTVAMRGLAVGRSVPM